MIDFVYFLLSALLPIVFFCFFIYLRDTEKEPVSVLFKAFLLGGLIIIPVFFIEIFLMNILWNSGVEGSLMNFIDAFFVVSVIEEGFKFLALIFFLKNNKHFNQRYDGIVFATFISLGFASVENILYIYNQGVQIALMRAFMTIPAHMLFAVFMGYHISLTRFGNPAHKARHFLLAILIPFILHGLYDFFLFDLEQSATFYFLAVIILCLGMWFYGLKRIRELISFDKSETENSDFNSKGV